MNIEQFESIIENNPTIFKMVKYCPYEILRHWEYVKYLNGDIVCHQGQQYDCFYIIHKGRADIYFMSETGKKYSQAIYQPGDYIGELEIFDRRPYSCYVKALTDLYLIKIQRDYFMQWLELDRNFSINLVQSLCNHFYRLSQKAGEDALYTHKNRVCNYLLSYGNSREMNDAAPKKIVLEREKLSDRFGVTPRSINRILMYLRKKGIIEIAANVIVIKNKAGLISEGKSDWNE